jgi:hypothetical protein
MRTPWKHNVNTMRTPWKHHANTMRTLWKHNANTMGTQCEHHGNTMPTPCEHHANTNQKTVWDLNSGGNNSNKIQNSVGTIQTEFNSNRIRAGTIQTEFGREHFGNSIQTGFGREQFKQNSGGNNLGGNNSNRIRACLNEFLNCGLGKLDPGPSLRTSVDNLQKRGTKTYLCLWESISIYFSLYYSFYYLIYLLRIIYIYF